MEPPPSLPAPPLLLDGAMGSALRAAGMPDGVCTETWALAHPAPVIDLQRRFVAAGCDVLYTPTFGANRLSLLRAGEEVPPGRVRELNLRLAALTQEAAAREPGRRCLVAGNLAGYGLPPDTAGAPSFDALTAAYGEQAAALAEAGADLLICETITGLSEARAALLAARETGLPVMVTLTVDEGGNTLTGARLLPAVITLQALGAAAVGLNCSSGPISMAEWLAGALPYAAVPLAAKPAASYPTREKGWVTLGPDAFAAAMEPLLDAGAVLTGGCCGAGPEHLRRLRELIDRHPTVVSPEIDTNAAAGEQEAFFLSEDLNPSPPLLCDSSLPDALIEAEDTYNVARVHVSCPEDVEQLIRQASMSRLPTAVYAETAALLEDTLRRYPGRLLVDTMGGMDAGEAAELAARYGAIPF
ncbi:MAG: homocysteine S-methyltransferase family protein [Clostridiales bacterium]|nr:homocysteine S-methyltransferase family protein [Clostridiales bacterium]